MVTLITLFSYTLGCNVSSTWCLHTTLVSLTPKIQENSITNIKYAHDCVKTTHTPLWQSHFYYRVWHSPHHHSTKSVVKNTEVGPLPAEQITSQCTAAQKSCVFDHTNDTIGLVSIIKMGVFVIGNNGKWSEKQGDSNTTYLWPAYVGMRSTDHLDDEVILIDTCPFLHG